MKTLFHCLPGNSIADSAVGGLKAGRTAAFKPTRIALLFAALTLTLLFAACDNPASATEDTTPPADVTNLAADAGIGQVTLNWTNPTDDDFEQAEITFSPEATNVKQPIFSSGRAETKTITGLANGTEYTFTVVAMDVSGNKSDGITITATPGDTTPPANVTGLFAEAGNGQITLSWADPLDSDLASIKITFAPVAAGVDQPIIVSKGAQRRTVQGLANGTDYTFTLVAVDNFGNESEGPYPTATETPDEGVVNDTTPPAAVAGLAAEAGDGQAILTWANPADDDFDHLEITFTPAVESVVQPIIALKGAQIRIITGLANGTAYTFTVTALDTSDNRSPVATATATPEDTTPPANVAGLQAEAGNAQAILTWTDPADADFDHLEITFSPGVAQPITVAKGTQSRTITGLTNGTRYTFTVIAVDASNNKSSGATATATPEAPVEDQTAADLIRMGSERLVAQSYDSAVQFYESAYEKDGNDPGAIVYSSIAKLASIAKDQKVQDLMKNRFGLSSYPGTIDALVSGSWLEDDEDFAGGSLTGDGFSNVATMQLLLFTKLLDKNANGLNDLLDQTLDAVFGANFDEAAARVAKLNYDQSASLDEAIVNEFGLTEFFGGDIAITKVEMDLLIASIRLVKATLEWINAYDWNTDLNFLKDWDGDESSLGSLLDNIGENSLPLKNNFLKDRGNGQMAASKADFIEAIDGAINAYDHIDNEGLIPPSVKDEIKSRQWIKSGLTALKTALDNGGIFWMPDGMPEGNGWNYSEANGFIGVNLGHLFTSDYLSIDKIIENTDGIPVMYGVPRGGEDPAVKISSKEAMANYDAFSFKFKTGPLYGAAGVIVKIDGMEDQVPAEYVARLFSAAIAEAIWDAYHK
jgi:chitodextrinase